MIIKIPDLRQSSFSEISKWIKYYGKIKEIDFNNLKKLKNIAIKSNNLLRLVFYSSKENKEIQIDNFTKKKIKFIKKKINLSSCGIVNLKNFVLNLSHFTEAQHHNTCLNRKISIDAEGNIKKLSFDERIFWQHPGYHSC